MLIVAYIILSVAVVIHAGLCLKGLFRSPKVAWNHDKHGMLALVMLLLIAATNAAGSFAQNLALNSTSVLHIFFGVGRTEGVLQLGLVGLYWVLVGIISMIVLFGIKRAGPSETVKLPPGGLWTVWGYMALLVLLVGLIIWGLR